MGEKKDIVVCYVVVNGQANSILTVILGRVTTQVDFTFVRYVRRDINERAI